MPELIERFGTTRYRQQLLGNLQKVMTVLRENLDQPVYIDGGFVTSSGKPSDIDIVIDMLDAPQTERTKAFRLMLQYRGKWLTKWHIDYMPELPNSTESFLSTFQKVGPNTAARIGVTPDHPKGILVLRS